MARRIEFLAELVGDGDLSPECVRWLREGAKHFVAESGSFEAALGLNCVHSRGARFAVRRAIMAAHLQKAAETLPAHDNWTRAKLLNREILAFLRRPGRPCRTDLDRHLRAAYEIAGSKLPASVTGLYGILVVPVDHHEQDTG
jgi:hypothetical protein